MCSECFLAWTYNHSGIPLVLPSSISFFHPCLKLRYFQYFNHYCQSPTPISQTVWLNGWCPVSKYLVNATANLNTFSLKKFNMNKTSGLYNLGHLLNLGTAFLLSFPAPAFLDPLKNHPFLVPSLISCLSFSDLIGGSSSVLLLWVPSTFC